MASTRQVVLDTETTGLSAVDGHRIVEIGCVELVDRRASGRTLHLYLNPEREIDEGALAVHGLSLDRLRDEPRFEQIAQRLIEFVSGAEILIHNAPFDVGFLDAEFARLERAPFAQHVHAVTDTLTLARALHPGKRNSLDALCDRYGVSNAQRVLHGALLDAQLLAEVYLAMTRGQDSLQIQMGGPSGAERPGRAGGAQWPPVGLIVQRADDSEAAAHAALLAGIAKETRGPALWSVLDADETAAAPAPV